MPTWLWVIICVVCSIMVLACIDVWCGEWAQPHLHIDSPPTRITSTPAVPKAPPPPKKSERGAGE